MTNEQKIKIASFISRHIKCIRDLRQRFDVAPVDASAEALYQDLRDLDADPSTACQHVEDALRYLAFFLADFALHSQAMHVGTLLNEYRTRGRKHLGLTRSHIRKKVEEFATGYTLRPLRVLRLAGIFLVFFTASYYLFWLFSQSPAIIDDNGHGVKWYYYPYFSVVTLTTLGFGDMSPNTQSGAWGCIPAYLSCAEALAGYLVLGLFLSVMIIRLRIHPYSRIADWHKEYQEQVLQGAHEPLFYDATWPGYVMDEVDKSEVT